MTQSQYPRPYWTIEKVIGVGSILAVLAAGSVATVWYVTHSSSTPSGTSTQPNSNQLAMKADFTAHTTTQKILDHFVIFNATITGNRRQYTLQWSFGDGVGNPPLPGVVIGNSTVITQHEYGDSAGGRYTVTLSVSPSIPDPSCAGNLPNSICPVFTVAKTIALTPNFVIVIGAVIQAPFLPKNAGILRSVDFKASSCYSLQSVQPGCGQDQYLGLTFTATVLPGNLYSITLPNGVSYNISISWYNSTSNLVTETPAGMNVFTTDYVWYPGPIL